MELLVAHADRPYAPVRLVTLATCHNRRETTERGVGSLRRSISEAGRTRALSVSHVIVDDGCSDGTATAVRRLIPDVHVVEGGGNLFWAGGMRAGWEYICSNLEFDLLLVYNDDVEFFDSGVSELLETLCETGGDKPSAVVAGAFEDPATGRQSYGAWARSPQLHPLKFDQLCAPGDMSREPETLNMNAALIPRDVLECNGFLDEAFVHSCADFEFGLRVKRAGCEIRSTRAFVGSCLGNPQANSDPADEARLINAFRLLFSPRREPPRQRWVYYRRHAGRYWWFWFLTPYASLPVRWFLRRVSGGVSIQDQDAVRRG